MAKSSNHLLSASKNLYLLLRIRFAQLEILGSPMGGAYRYRDIFVHGLKLCGESRTKQVPLAFEKKIGGNHAFFRNNKASI